MSLLQDDRGFGLIEVVVSAFLTLVIAGAVLTALEVASRSSGNSRAQAIASTLAQQDQERLRSLPVAQLLPVPPQTSPVPNVDGVDYTVQSDSVALKNADGDKGCTAGGSGLVKIVSTVRSDGLAAGRRPVRVDSLVARPFVSASLSSGSALLILRDADDQPVTGQAVDLVGPASTRKTTDAEGCAYFPDIDPGDYTFSYTTAGWVDPNGDTVVTVPVSVAAQQLITKEQSYARGGSVPVTAVQTRVTARGASPFASVAPKIRFVNGSTVRSFDPDAAPLGLLYPFPTDYAVYTGTCGENAGLKPADVISIGSTFSQTVRVTPGAVAPAIRLFQPGIDAKATVAGVAVGGARVVFTPIDPACGPAIVRITAANGTLPDPGLPYGRYAVCADTGTLYYKNAPTVSNTDVNGRSLSLPLAPALGRRCVT